MSRLAAYIAPGHRMARGAALASRPASSRRMMCADGEARAPAPAPLAVAAPAPAVPRWLAEASEVRVLAALLALAGATLAWLVATRGEGAGLGWLRQLMAGGCAAALGEAVFAPLVGWPAF